MPKASRKLINTTPKYFESKRLGESLRPFQQPHTPDPHPSATSASAPSRLNASAPVLRTDLCYNTFRSRLLSLCQLLLNPSDCGTATSNSLNSARKNFPSRRRFTARPDLLARLGHAKGWRDLSDVCIMLLIYRACSTLNPIPAWHECGRVLTKFVTLLLLSRSTNRAGGEQGRRSSPLFSYEEAFKARSIWTRINILRQDGNPPSQFPAVCSLNLDPDFDLQGSKTPSSTRNEENNYQFFSVGFCFIA